MKAVAARVGLAGAVLAAGACAGTPAVRLPEGPWAPDEGAAAVFAEASTACRGIRTYTAELSVSGRAGGTRLRGRVLAGFERPGRLRLEGVAPFGAPVFVLASAGAGADLWLPRERRAVRGAAVADLLEALTGIRRTADDLVALVGGCVVADPRPAGGSRGPGGWWSVRLGDALTAFVQRQDAAWRIRSARAARPGSPRDGWTLEYGEFMSGFPGRIRLQERSAAAETDLTFRVSQRDVNVAIDAAAFVLRLPADVEPMTIEELRARGPLADPGGGREEAR